MKKFRLTSILFSLLMVVSSNTLAQEKEEFKPSGKFIIRSFADYSSGLGHMNKEAGFDLTRAFLGYEYQISPTLSARVLLDGASGRTDANKLEVYLRNAYINWKDYGFNVSAGEVNTVMFDLQSKYWKHRYVMAMLQDLNKMGHSVDIGAIAEYQFSPLISADISVLNGEGYKNINKKNKSMKYAAGVTASFLDGAVVRVYGDVYTEDETMRDALPTGVTADSKNQYNLGTFVGYQNATLSVGAEYNRIFNKGFIKEKEFSAYSAYASTKVAKKWGVYARYDYTTSNTPDGFASSWNKLDGSTAVVGVEFSPLKQVKISPNFRNMNPSHSRSEQYLFLNLEFSL